MVCCRQAVSVLFVWCAVCSAPQMVQKKSVRYRPYQFVAHHNGTPDIFLVFAWGKVCVCRGGVGGGGQRSNRDGVSKSSRRKEYWIPY